MVICKKKWESDIFLDVERASTANTFDQAKFTFLFRETSRMFYQVLIWQRGISKNKGFEQRDYFDNQNYVFLKNKVMLAGANKTGAAFYTFDFGTEEGKMIPLDVKGRVLQEINYDENQIEFIVFGLQRKSLTLIPKRRICQRCFFECFSI
jgi:hypothetical protein